MAGRGVSSFSELAVRGELSEGRLVRLALEGIRVVRTFIEGSHRDKRESPALGPLAEFARAYARAVGGQRGKSSLRPPPKPVSGCR